MTHAIVPVPESRNRKIARLLTSNARFGSKAGTGITISFQPLVTCETDMAAPQSPPEKMMFQLSLRRRGISDQAVLRTMEEVPREAFVEMGDAAFAYRDSALGIA